MLTLLMCVISRSMVVAGIVLVVTGILTVYKGGIPLFRYIHFMCVPFAFLVLSTLAVMINVKKTPLDLFAVPVGSWYITSSVYGMTYAIQLILTALSAVSCLYYLSMNTPMPDILRVLDRLHCPKLLIELMMLIYRFIFVLLDTSYHISTAQECRMGNEMTKNGITVCMATHDVNYAYEWADEIALFCQGKVLMQDTPEVVFHNREALQQTNLEVPTVLELFESLCRKGILDKALPAPKNLQALEKYIEEIPGH